MKIHISSLKAEYNKLFEDNVAKSEEINKLNMSLSSLANDYVELQKQNKSSPFVMPELSYNTSSSSVDSLVYIYENLYFYLFISLLSEIF